MYPHIGGTFGQFPSAERTIEGYGEDEAARREIAADWVVSAGHRVPDLDLWEATGKRFSRVGDAVAPRTIAEAVLEGRRAAMAVEGASG